MAVLCVTAMSGFIVGGLSPMQRFHATGDLQSNWMSEGWLIAGAVIVLVVLVLLLVAVSVYRVWREKRASEFLLIRKAERKRLSAHEIGLLKEVANNAGMRDKSEVIMIEEAFNRGANAVIDKGLERGLVRDEIVKVKAELAYLRDKIGFQEGRNLPEAQEVQEETDLGSRQIPVGRQLHITRRIGREDDGIEAMVLENTEAGLRIQLSKQIKVNFGDFWKVKYNFGISVWEFEGSVVSYDGNVLVLSHSDNVRFVSRRRFQGMAVRLEGFIASFPFSRSLGAGSLQPVGSGSGSGGTVAGEAGYPLSFFPATIVELAGSWMKLETVGKMEAGQRVLVLMKVEVEAGANVAKGAAGGVMGKEIIEDIGEVKRVESNGVSFVVTVELTGLSDADVDRLVSISGELSAKTARVGRAGKDYESLMAPDGAGLAVAAQSGESGPEKGQ